MIDDREAEMLKNIMIDTIEHERRRIENEIWEGIKKVIDNPFELNAKIFGDNMLSLVEITSNFTASEFMAKLKEYEDKNVIHVGDEVIADGNKFVVVNKIKDEFYTMVWGIDGRGFHYEYVEGACRKTGRSFPQVAELLKEISRE